MSDNSTPTKPRTITVAGDRREIDIPLTIAGIADLISRGAIYDCGDGHDMHLDPSHDWTVEDVEALLLAIDHEGMPAERRRLPDDFAIIVNQGEPSEHHSSLAHFLRENADAFDHAEIMAIEAALTKGVIYRSGGGAEAEWSVAPAQAAA